jgi:hypothetical protein
MATLGAFSLRAAPCSAEPKSSNACEVAYERAQVARVEGDLLSATDNLVSCAGVSCSDAMQIDCNRWLEEVRVSVPTVVFRAVDQRGADIPSATVAIDGHPEVPLNGRAISVNPGPHEVTLRAPGFSARSERLQFVEGHKLRSEAVALTALEAVGTRTRTSAPFAVQAGTPSSEKTLLAKGSPAKEASVTSSGRHIGPTQWVAGGVAAVGALGFIYFGSTARSADHALDRCSPNCSKTAVSDVKHDYLYANLSLGVGLAAVATGVIQYLTQDTAAPQTSHAAGVTVSVAPRSLQVAVKF